jgi:hypothetical protein
LEGVTVPRHLATARHPGKRLQAYSI